MIDFYLGNTAVPASKIFSAFLAEGALINLMKPVPVKAPLENKSLADNGKEVIVNDEFPLLLDERDVTLEIIIKADTQEDMLMYWKRMMSIIQSGIVTLKTTLEPDVIYHLVYKDCTQLRTYFRGIAKFQIKFNEPNPANRT